ncbi:nickel-binding protein [Agromyces sp. NPDC127015]|uniref:nickel-binding protein n=1 Tax=Agromyces sp. NPDC127015 TaxID=3347108 RepID=UPI003646D87F
MKTFIIEREVPGAARLSHAELAEISTVSNAAVDSLGVEYDWVTTYVAGDKLYDDAETVREHARRGGFPANLVSEVVAEFGPHTAAEMA